MQVTASGNFEKNKTWNGIKKHLEHDEKLNHSNKYLQTDTSKYYRQFNQHLVLLDYDKWTKEKFGKYVLSHDEKAAKKSRLVYGSVENFLKTDSTGKKRTKTLDKLFSEKFSDKEDYENLFTNIMGIIRKNNPNLEPTDYTPVNKIAKFVSDSLADYHQGFNQRNKYIKMFEAYIHVDEQGAPHGHARVMPFVPNKDPNKKPSWSLNKALKLQFGSKNGRENLSKFREQEDLALINSFNKTLEKEIPEAAKQIHFDLVRSPDSRTGLDHEIYVRQKQIDDLKQKMSNLIQLSKRETNLNEREQDLNDREQALATRENNCTLREQNVSKRENKLSDDVQEVNQKVVAVNQRDKDLDKKAEKINELTSKNQDLVKRNEQMAIQLQQQISIVQKMREDMARAFNKAKGIASNWKKNAYQVGLAIYNTFRLALTDGDSDKEKEFDDPEINPGRGEIDFYQKNIMSFPDDTQPSEWSNNHWQNHQFSWLVNKQNRQFTFFDDNKFNKKIDRAKTVMEKQKELEKQGKDQNNDGIDDTKEYTPLKEINTDRVDPLLAENNRKQKQNNQYSK